MTVTRTRIVVLTGAIMIAAAGAGSFAFSRDAARPQSDTSPFPVGQAFTPTEWAGVTRTLARRGFDPATLRVVSGMRLQSPDEPFALIRAASRSRGLCFVPVRGAYPGNATCSLSGRLEKPLLVYAATDRWGGRAATDIVGVAPHSVVGVSMIDSRGFESGVALIPSTGRLWSFAGGYGDATLIVQARLASGRVAARTRLP